MATTVSVVIVAYRQEAFIEEAVRSALVQVYPALEVIVADDASPDGTVARLEPLLREYGERLRIVRGDRNVGITANHNRGLRAARGDLVAFQGGDDVLLPGKLAAQVAWFESRPRAVLCGHDVEVFDHATGAVAEKHFSPHRVWTGIGADAIIRYGAPFVGTAAMLRRGAMPPAGLDERLAVAADWWLYIETVGQFGEWGQVHGSLARYRRHGGGVTQMVGARTRLQEIGVEDTFLTLALAESRFPQFADAARDARARLQYSEMRYAIRQGVAQGALDRAAAVPVTSLRWWLRCMVLRTMLLLPGGAERFLRWHERNAW